MKVENLTSTDFEYRDKLPKILMFDIESSPAIVATWRKYESDAIWVVEESKMICWSAKWLNGRQVTKALPDYDNYKPGKLDDKQLCIDLWDLLNQADLVCAHNGDRFDVRYVKARFIKHGLPPCPPIKSIDTKKMAKREFGFFSNKLDDIGDFLDLGRKIQTGGYTLWKDCMAGDMKAWRKMKAYNAQDTRLLESVYLKLRDWDKQHPNLNVYTGQKEACPKCGSPNTQKRGFSITATGRVQRFHCQNCSAWSLGKHTKITEVR